MTERTTEELSKSEIARIHKEFAINCKKSFRFYCEHNCKIIDKNGEKVPFIFNEAQEILFETIRKQMREDNQIRIVIVKARQIGASTFCRALINWRLSYYPRELCIFTAQTQADIHEKHLRGLRSMYHDQVQIMPLSHETKSSLEVDHGAYGKSAIFGQTANSPSRGAMATIAVFTEVDFYDDFNQIYDSLTQSLPSGNGTIIAIESTSGGHKALYDLHKKSLNRDNPYVSIFVPWYLMSEYRADPPCDFVITSEEKELKEEYNLEDSQIFWYRVKLQDLGSQIVMNREYPSKISDSFAMSGGLSFFDYDHVKKAIESPLIQEYNKVPLIMGLDVSRNRDQSAMVLRRGRNIIEIKDFAPTGDLMRLADELYYLIADRKPDFVFLDASGLGFGVLDRLKAKGVRNLIGIQFSERADDSSLYMNKRSEMYARFQIWLSNHPCSIPDNEEFLDQILKTEIVDRAGKLLLKPKHLLKKSPDMLDAAILTFAGGNDDYLAFSAGEGTTIDMSASWDMYNL